MTLSEAQAISRFMRRHGGLGQVGAGSAVAVSAEMEPEAFTTFYRCKDGRPGKIRIIDLPSLLKKRDSDGQALFTSEKPQLESGPSVTAGAANGLAVVSGTKRKRQRRRRRGKRGH